MAGRGFRFASAGYHDPKPLISVGGKPMIQWVVENIRPSCPHRFTFICLSEHLDKYPQVESTLRSLCPNCSIVTIEQVTEGAACTVLLAKHIFANNDPLMIANADQFVELDINSYLQSMEVEKADGLIMTFSSNHPKWSYCRMDFDNTVCEVVEKVVVSNHATVGIYNFRRGSDFIAAAEKMIRKNLRVNNEFYVAPAYNHLIDSGFKVITQGTGSEYAGMFGLGVPLDLEFFKTTNHYVSGRNKDTAIEKDGIGNMKRFSRIINEFVCENNRAGVAAILADDVVLDVNGGKRFVGRFSVVEKILESEVAFKINRERQSNLLDPISGHINSCADQSKPNISNLFTVLGITDNRISHICL